MDMIANHLTPYLLVSATLFCLGICCVLTRRNSIGILIGVELILNAANLNLVAFSRFVAPNPTGGQVFATIVIMLAASEAVIFLALLVAIYQTFDTIEVDQIKTLNG